LDKKLSVTPLHPDQKYIEALLNNTDVLIEEIYVRYLKDVRRHVLTHRGQENDVMDLFHESLRKMIIYARRNEVKLTVPFGAFFRTFYTIQWIKIKNQNKGVINDDITESINKGVIEPKGNLEEEVLKEFEDLELQQLVKKHLSALGPTCQDILRKFFWENMSNGDIAKDRSTTKNFIAKKKADCRRMLIDRIKRDPDFQDLNEE